MQEMWVHSLGQENPLEKGMATHSKILAWEIPWTEEPGGLHIPWDGKDLNTTKRLSTHTHHHLQEAFFLPPSCSFSLQISTIHYVLFQMREALVDVVQRTRGSDPYSTMNCVCDSKQFTSSLWNVMYSVIHSINNISLFPLYGAYILVGEIGY